MGRTPIPLFRELAEGEGWQREVGKAPAAYPFSGELADEARLSTAAEIQAFIISPP
jgi:hypothetical protein